MPYIKETVKCVTPLRKYPSGVFLGGKRERQRTKTSKKSERILSENTPLRKYPSVGR